MAEGSNKRKKKATISQEDVYPLLQRYSADTVFTLLKEVAEVADTKIDWDELVKKTATGITNAREYQMLWRHLAYHDTVEDEIDEGAVPLDDDSDIEFELEAYPPVSGDSLTEATACVKVLFASASLDANSGLAIEAPLTVNIPSGWSLDSASGKPQLQETKTTISCLVPKQPTSLPRVESSEDLDAIEVTGRSLPHRRKRNLWTKEEDEELIAAVRKHGAGNWANILKEGEFKGDRNSSQLSQRWSFIKKQQKNSNVGVGPPTADVSAVRKAFNIALDMPMVDSNSIPQNAEGGSNSNTTTALTSSQSQHQHQPDFEPATTSSKLRSMNRIKPSTSPALSPDAMVKAAAFAAGARIATPSVAATLLKAAQSKNAVHTIPSGINSIKSSGPSNVHFFGRGLNKSTSGFNPPWPAGIPRITRPGTGAGKGGEKLEEKKITEVQVERERENKPKPEKEGSEMAEEKNETDM